MVTKKRDAGAPRKVNLGLGDKTGSRWLIRLSVHITGDEKQLIGSRYEGRERDVTEDDLAKVFHSDKQDWQWTGQMEKGEQTGYEHFQIALRVMDGKTKKSVIINRGLALGVPIEDVRLSISWQGSIDYVTKDETRIAGPYKHYEGDEFLMAPVQGKRTDIQALRDAVANGMDKDAILTDEKLGNIASGRLAYLDRLVAIRDKEIFGRHDRKVECHYLWGKARLGKTWSITHDDDGGYRSDVYRPTDWKNPWDEYAGQSVLLLDEFYGSGQLDFPTLLNVLDTLPLVLHRRYGNAYAKWTTVWIVSNQPLQMLYESYELSDTQREALRKRIRTDEVMLDDGEPVGHHAIIPTLSLDVAQLRDFPENYEQAITRAKAGGF